MHAALATLDIMESRRGYEKLPELGILAAESIRRGLEQARIGDLVKAEPVMNGSMFDVWITEDNQYARHLRDLLKQCFSSNGVLLLTGHPSFVCLQHQYVDWGDLAERSFRAGREWASRAQHLLE